MPTSFFSKLVRTLLFVLTLWVGFNAQSVAPAQAQTPDGPKVEVTLISGQTSVVPGQPFQVGLKQRIRKNWHTYWKNPGDSGQPTNITWSLPDGFTASDIQWPIPTAIPYGPLMNYGYSDEVLLSVTITPPETIDARTITLKGKADWLVCERICIPETADVELTLRVAPPGSESLPSRNASDFENIALSLSNVSPWQVKALLGDEKLALRIDAPKLQQDRIGDIYFFPSHGGIIDHAGKQRVSWATGGPQLTTIRSEKEIKAEDLTPLQGVLVITEDINGKTVRNGFNISAAVSKATTADFEYGQPPLKDGVYQTGIALWQALVFALIGGLILNLMPCVLPILSLKVISLASHGREEAEFSAGKSGLWYLAGVMVSFAVLAILLIALKSAGTALGWGFQFQSPLFVLVMAGVFLLIGLSLSGVFELGSGLEGSGASFANRSGASGSFFTGALATLAATPCTAPFMGAAVGYALSRSSVELFAVLMALGLGFAIPMVALSFSGAAAKILPKPGPWMETLKQALAFPLYATVAWLVWVLSVQSGSSGVLGAAIILVALGFAAWLMGKVGISFWVRAVATAFIVFVAFALTIPMLESTRAFTKKHSTMNVDVPALNPNSFSQQRLDKLRSQGRPVFVNFTAAWCITCKVNEQLALSSKTFHDAMKAKNVAYLKGDWTRQDAKITSVLNSFQRSGVPLYLLYPADKNASPVVLPQLLTPGIVLAHLKDLPDPARNSTPNSSGH